MKGTSRGARRARPVSGFARLGGVAAAFAFAACGGAEPAPADEPASLQAVLSIERLEDASHAASSSASAMAQFVVLPADADAHETLLAYLVCVRSCPSGAAAAK